MREIKFRAWDLDNFEMYYTDKEYDVGDGPIIWDIQENGVFFLENTMINECPGGMGHVQSMEYLQPKQTIMQYTGLKDINGKEIYEGDYIAFRFRTKDANFLYQGVVVFDEFMFVVDVPNAVRFSLNRINSVNIIGNIHKTPKLV